MSSNSVLVIAWVGLLGACSSSGAPSRHDEYASLQSAVTGHPDEETREAIEQLATLLDARDWAYLAYARWPDDHGQAALLDPILRRAVLALASLAPTELSPQATGGPAPGEPPSKYDDKVWQERFDNGIEILKRGELRDYAGTPAIAAAWSKLLSGALKNTTGSILPDPIDVADPFVDGCGEYFYEGGVTGSDCSAIDFCCRGIIDMGRGKTLCDDFETCRGDGDPPLLSVGEAGTDEPSTPPDASADQCALAGIPNAARVPACDCTIGVGSSDVEFADPGSSTGGHWCCGWYSTGPECNGDKATCFYVDVAPDAQGCCAKLPDAPPPLCAPFDDPTVRPEVNGAPVCCAR